MRVSCIVKIDFLYYFWDKIFLKKVGWKIVETKGVFGVSRCITPCTLCYGKNTKQSCKLEIRGAIVARSTNWKINSKVKWLVKSYKSQNLNGIAPLISHLLELISNLEKV